MVPFLGHPVYREKINNIVIQGNSVKRSTSKIQLMQHEQYTTITSILV